MYPKDDAGRELNAEFSVEADSDHLAVILESAGGVTAGRQAPRNADYREALELLLRRLAQLDAVLLGAFVDSRNVQHLDESERALLSEPVALAAQRDFEELRRLLTSRQGRIGQREGAPKAGNNSKRLRLRLNVPEYGPDDAKALESDLAGAGAGRFDVVMRPVPARPASWVGGNRVDAYEVLRELIGAEVRTVVTDKPNLVMGVRGHHVEVATENSPEGKLIPVAEVQAGIDRLMAQGSVLVSPPELGYRSWFIGAVLATLPGAVVRQSRPVVIALSEDDTTEQSTGLDGKVLATYRKEQGKLRRSLLDGRAAAACALCGEVFPEGFLVAAHIKKRSLCTDKERLNLSNVAMLACRFGCDHLYEYGYVTVSENGRVQVARTGEPVIDSRLTALADRACGAHHAGSEPYFAWHRANVFREAVG
ncbi:hypothetical protein JOF41_004356 [Saccharothrix coeruleofusca]|uniref:hypothetical protein n=1 Tax=Saccharothrix coeruleofusca TaxID=33919 RepID=UPI001AE73AC9|nr:hypothetical protein [Saccharothrix coeruleofusca]MBP2338178.1 hypothetical protein [Saccharothrix coeruleofusca]